MRAWKMTAGLVVVAAIAAILAPRLMPRAVETCSAPPVLADDPLADVLPLPCADSFPEPEVVVAPVRVEPPPRPAPPRMVPIGASGGRVQPGMIPEATTPLPQLLPQPVTPIEPDPKLEIHWEDMVDCGMG